MTLLHDYPLFTVVSYTMITPVGQSSAARAHPLAVQLYTWQALRKWRFNFNVHHVTHWLQWWDWRLWKHTAHSSEALPRSRLPGNCCYATVDSPIKVQRVARWSWTAPQCSKYLWGAVFTLRPQKAQRKVGKHMFNSSALSASGMCREKKNHVNSQNDASHE